MVSKNNFFYNICIFSIAFLGLVSLAQCERSKKEPVAEGLPAPVIEITDATNVKRVSTSDLHGKVLFIHFWATWCESCREELPLVEKLFVRFLDDDRFVMLTILFKDDPQYALSVLKQNGFNLPLLIDAGNKAAKSYGLTGVPETYIVDKKGILRKIVIGPYNWDAPEAVSLISELLME